MITVHHLRFSRSTRILWLLEELGVPYEMVAYDRDPATFRRPPALGAVHPLGKAPVIDDDGVLIAESGAIIEFVIEKYGAGRLAPLPGTADRAAYLEWLHFAEGTAMLGFIMGLFAQGGSERGNAYAAESRSLALAALDGALGEREFLVGDTLTGADINNYYVVAIADARGMLEGHPRLKAYHARLAGRPALQRALELGGPVTPPGR